MNSQIKKTFSPYLVVLLEAKIGVICLLRYPQCRILSHATLKIDKKNNNNEKNWGVDEGSPLLFLAQYFQ